jgi:hypothetical protein
VKYALETGSSLSLAAPSAIQNLPIDAHEEVLSLKHVVFDCLKSLLLEPGTKRPNWLLGFLPPLIVGTSDLKPLLRSAMHLAWNRSSSDESTTLYVATRLQGTMLILQIDERPQLSAKGTCLVSVALGQMQVQ